MGGSCPHCTTGGGTVNPGSLTAPHAPWAPGEGTKPQPQPPRSALLPRLRAVPSHGSAISEGQAQSRHSHCLPLAVKESRMRQL